MNLYKKINQDKKSVNYIQWNITRRCNYDCSYCFTKKRRIDKRRRMAFNDPDPYTFLNRFSEHLPGSWQFYLCGSGEPFMTPKFLKIVNRLVKMKHQVGVMTNFSAPEEKIVEFCKITGNKLFEFSASMHLEHVNLKEFLQKAILVKQLVGDKFSVRSVARKGRLSELEKIGQSFRNKGNR